MFVESPTLFVGNPLTLSGFELRGEPTEIYIQYDTLATTNNNYADNVRFNLSTLY